MNLDLNKEQYVESYTPTAQLWGKKSGVWSLGFEARQHGIGSSAVVHPSPGLHAVSEGANESSPSPSSGQLHASTSEKHQSRLISKIMT
jgi:hypothetical protein